MKLPNSKEILADVQGISQKIKKNQLDASDNLKKALDTFSNTNEKDVQQEISFIKKYNPEVYKEYVDIVKKDKLSKRIKKPETPLKSADSLDKIDWSWNFVERYKRDKKLATLLNQEYYWSDEWWFWWGFNRVYDEWNIVFANSTWKSKIFTFNGEKLSDIWKKYYEIQRCWDFYVWVQVQTRKDGDSERLVEGSHTYVILDKEGHEIRNLRWHFHQRSSDGIYVETYKQWDKEMRAYYDENMNIIVDAIELKNQLLFFKDGKCLFENFNSWEKGKFTVEKGKSWDGKYMSEEMIKNEDFYKEYKIKTDAIDQENREKQLERDRIIREWSMDFDLGFDENWYIKSITDNSWNLVFVANDGYKYISKYPDRLHPSDFTHYKPAINRWIFVLCGLDQDWKYKRDVFVNAKNNVKLTFDTHPDGTFVNNQVMQHFITWYTSELYNLSGQKLWKQLATDHDDYDYKVITGQDDKKQLVECKTWTVKEQKFDKELKRYDEKNEVVVIVGNWDDIVELHIKK